MVVTTNRLNVIKQINRHFMFRLCPLTASPLLLMRNNISKCFSLSNSLLKVHILKIVLNFKEPADSLEIESRLDKLLRW